MVNPLAALNKVLAALATAAGSNPVAAASLFVSVCALLFTVFQARETEYRNRLSLLPHLQFGQDEPTDQRIELTLENGGVGPARISGLEANVGGTFMRFTSEIDWARVQQHSDPAFRSLLQRATLANVPVMAFLAQQHKVELVTISVSTPEEKSTARAGLEQLHIGVCYCSLYGDCFHVATLSGESHDESCKFDGTIKVLGKRLRFHSLWSSPIDSLTTHGYD